MVVWLYEINLAIYITKQTNSIVTTSSQDCYLAYFYMQEI